MEPPLAPSKGAKGGRQNDETMTKYTLPDDIPQKTTAHLELCDLPQWVAWHYQEANGRMRKPPVNPHSGRLADVTDPTTWGTYCQALERQFTDDCPGVGFVLTEAGGLVGIDLDDCIDARGEISDEAMAIVLTMDSYTERSPSGTGLHILVKATMPGPSVIVGNVEVYGAGHYLTYTGALLTWHYSILEARQTEVTTLYKALRKERAQGGDQPTAQAASLDDLKILDLMLRSKIGPQAAGLLRGDVSSYPSPSEADFRLCLYAAFYTGDAAQIDRIAHLTSLPHIVDGKWDRERHGPTYGAMTIEKALATQRNRYNPDWRGAV